MNEMTANLAEELDRFRERIQEDPTTAQVQWRPGSGGGSLGWLTIALLAVYSTFRRKSHGNTLESRR
ncbi:MAG: GlyGly-CTERM sorting domain-containing protein [Gammaproteobacteria bacterium]|nr:GlyGly-CTERM sorting domain-containing protein [Gammaproteobacteria bacterium]